MILVHRATVGYARHGGIAKNNTRDGRSQEGNQKANIIAVTGPQTSNKCVKHQLESS